MDRGCEREACGLGRGDRDSNRAPSVVILLQRHGVTATRQRQPLDRSPRRHGDRERRLSSAGDRGGRSGGVAAEYDPNGPRGAQRGALAWDRAGWESERAAPAGSGSAWSGRPPQASVNALGESRLVPAAICSGEPGFSDRTATLWRWITTRAGLPLAKPVATCADSARARASAAKPPARDCAAVMTAVATFGSESSSKWVPQCAKLS